MPTMRQSKKSRSCVLLLLAILLTPWLGCGGSSQSNIQGNPINHEESAQQNKAIEEYYSKKKP